MIYVFIFLHILNYLAIESFFSTLADLGHFKPKVDMQSARNLADLWVSRQPFFTSFLG